MYKHVYELSPRDPNSPCGQCLQTSWPNVGIFCTLGALGQLVVVRSHEAKHPKPEP